MKYIDIPTFKLSNDLEIPCIGLGTMSSHTQEDMDKAIKAAYESGYRLIDSAFAYGNEEILGQAIKNVGIKREDIMITTKSRLLRHSYQDMIDTVYEQCKTLQTSYIDLYLLHWPSPINPPLYVEAWKALEKLYDDGVIKAIGVSNFFPRHLDKIIENCKYKPMINQMQINPYYNNKEVEEYCNKHNIQLESWRPFWGGDCLMDQTVIDLAKKYNKSAAQLILRWQHQHGYLPIPGPIEPEWINENANIFNFEITDEDMARIDAMESNKPALIEANHGVYDPDVFDMVW